MKSSTSITIIGFIISAFSIISAFFAVFDLPVHLQYAIFGTTVISIIIGLVMLVKTRKNNAAFKIIEGIIQRKVEAFEFEAHLIKNEFELADYIKSDEDEFGEDAYSADQIKNMWRTYPKGAHGLFNKHTGELVGACGLWPIKKGVFNELMKGKRSEMEITYRSLDTKDKRFWYIGGIYLDPKLRKTTALKVFLYEILSTWYNEVKDYDAISSLSGVYTKDGELLIKKLGFREINNRLNKYPVYVALDINPDKILKIFEKIFQPDHNRVDNP